uniref:F-box domain-containing protein n=1 Tax=Globodera pallida TaxID=36090 RepID=A0A183CBF4_GLOPA
MSDHPSVQQHHLKEIQVCDDVCLTIFGFIGPADLGLKLALVCYRFDGLVDSHLKSRRWALGSLEIRRKSNGTGAELVKWNGKTATKFPLAQGPPPEGGIITGFKCLSIRYVDDIVVEFLRHFRVLFAVGITLSVHVRGKQSWNAMKAIWPLLNDDIRSSRYFNTKLFAQLRRQISTTVLCDCINLRSIYLIDMLFPECPADDRDGTTAGQALCKWLHTPLENGQPKLFRTHCWDTMSMQPLLNQLKNLEPRHSGKGSLDWHMRCPIARDEEQWAKWEREAVEEVDAGHSEHFVNMDFADKDIGPLSVAGLNESK